jgi:hypothetical protein
MTFPAGQVLRRTMYVRTAGPDRLHVTADDMPGGADVLLRQRGFTSTPYVVLVSFAGGDWRSRCFDECRSTSRG